MAAHAPRIVSTARLRIATQLPDAWFEADGRAIADVAAVLDAFGVPVPDDALAESLPELRNIGIDAAPSGVLQDPAGSAVGAPALAGGGASGRIYARFPDLHPIPAMPPQAAVCNASSGPGRRVLHSHSPQLAGRPEREADRIANLTALATTYANALLALDAEREWLGDDAGVCNLVPVAASIYAGAFARDRIFEHAHLDPSYTIVAVVIAMAHVRSLGVAVPRTTLCFWEAEVHDRAVDCRVAVDRVLRHGVG